MWKIQFALNSKAAVLLRSTAYISLPSFLSLALFFSSEAAMPLRLLYPSVSHCNIAPPLMLTAIYGLLCFSRRIRENLAELF